MGWGNIWPQVLQDAFFQEVKVLIGTRKVWSCIDNLCCPFDECPFKLSAGEKRDTSNLQNVEGHKICFSCGHLANRQWYGAWKMKEYCRESETLTVYHLGMYMCLPKPNTMKYRSLVREAVLRNSGIVACVIQQAEMGEAVAAADIQEPWGSAMQLSYANLKVWKGWSCLWKEPKHSLEAVGILKRAPDMEDKFLIYKIINSQFSNDPDYMFKSSHAVAQIGVDMDEVDPENPSQGEEA